MPKTVEDLDKSLQDILKALQAANKSAGVGSGGGTGTGGAQGPKTLRDMFGTQFRQAQQGTGGIGSAIGGMARSAGNVAGAAQKGAMLGGPVGGIVAGLGQLGMELAKTPAAVKQFIEGLHGANRALSEYSSSMATVMARSDIKDIMRNMRRGELVAKSAGALSNARANLQDSLVPIETGWQKLENGLGALAGNIVTVFLEKSGLGENFGEWLNQMAETVMEWAKDWGYEVKKKNKMAENNSVQDELEGFIKEIDNQKNKKAANIRDKEGAAKVAAGLRAVNDWLKTRIGG